MALDERARHELFTRLEETLGSVPAETLIGYLPPVGWADVATKHDLHQLEERLDIRIDALGERLDAPIDALDERFGARLETVEHRVMARMDQQLAAQARVMALQTWAILGTVLVALAGAIVTTAFL
ncbi:MAG: hypothetical protein WD250_15805 [Egibacteraceae bacterium]